MNDGPTVRPTRAEVSLGALRANVRAVRAALSEDGAAPRLYGVVKADAYGHGAPAVALALESAGVDGLCVALVEEGVSLRYPIRAMVGDNEETHMNDVEYYLKNYPAPVFCFTPDAEFPVCNGEKGHFGAELVSPVCNGEIKEFEGGVANNAVPDRASALVETDITKLKNAPNITLEPEGNGVRIRGWGKSGHAAMPEGTVNAIGLVVNYLLDNGLCNDAERAYLEALKKLHASTAGTGLGIDCADGPFGPLTIIGGRIFMREGRIVQTMDSRYPTCTNAEKMKEQIKAAIGTGASLEKAEGAEPFYIAADTPAIKACIETYNEVTGENATPFTMGGGTYARHFPYAVSFGPEHEDMVLPEFGGPMHGANEAAPIDKLLEALPEAGEMKDAIVRLTIDFPRELEPLIDERRLQEKAVEAFQFVLYRRPSDRPRGRIGDSHETENLTPLELLDLYWKESHLTGIDRDQLKALADGIINASRADEG